jgi:hypothetical protein
MMTNLVRAGQGRLPAVVAAGDVLASVPLALYDETEPIHASSIDQALKHKKRKTPLLKGDFMNSVVEFVAG